MTKKLYYKDAYLSVFSAEVISCVAEGELYSVVLDKTAFFPEEGGQYSDKGRLDGALVSNAKEKDGIIYHYTDRPLEVGALVEGSIDFDERYEKMQCHTAEHILSGIIHKKFGLSNVGFHLGAEEVTMDISAPLSADELMQIERMANEVVYKNVEVTVLYPSPDELLALSYRSKLDITENVRIVNVGEYDSCACCAPHVRMTGEIGSIKILDFVKLRGGMRIRICAGRRAYKLYCEMYRELSEISHLLSVPRLEAADGVKKLLSDYENKKAEYKSARASLFEAEAEKILPTEKNRVIKFNDATQEELRLVGNLAYGRIGGVLVLLSGCDGDYKYIIFSSSVDLKTEIKKINAALQGRGGGSSVMAQGSFASTLTDIQEYFI